MNLRQVLYMVAEADKDAALWLATEILNRNVIWDENEANLDRVLSWNDTPQGFDFWSRQHHRTLERGF